MLRKVELDAWVAQWVRHLALAQVMISGSWDRALRWASCSAGSLVLHLPLQLALLVLSLCQIKSFLKRLRWLGFMWFVIYIKI